MKNGSVEQASVGQARKAEVAESKGERWGWLIPGGSLMGGAWNPLDAVAPRVVLAARMVAARLVRVEPTADGYRCFAKD